MSGNAMLTRAFNVFMGVLGENGLMTETIKLMRVVQIVSPNPCSKIHEEVCGSFDGGLHCLCVTRGTECE